MIHCRAMRCLWPILSLFLAFIFLSVGSWAQTLSIEQIEQSRAQVTDADIRAVSAKVDELSGNLSAIWTKILVGNNKDSRLPQLKGFTTGSFPCGEYVLGKNTLAYCSPDDTIYYDKVLMAAFVRLTAAHDHDSGMYGALVAFAHEWGHAIYRRSGETTGILEEAAADCFAGVAMRALERMHSVNADDLKDARYSLTLAADAFENTDLRPGVKTILDQGVHGAASGRIESFDIGYNHGAPACTSKLPVQLNSAPWRQ